MTRLRLAALVLGSPHPRRATAWYREALGLPEGQGVLDAAGARLIVRRRFPLAPVSVEPERVIPNFLVDDARAVERRLVAMEVTWVRELELTPWGLIGTVVDPDGNYVQVIETSKKGMCS